MGREVRKVPVNWVHPKANRYGKLSYRPMHDQRHEHAEQEWLVEFDRIRAGGMTEFEMECYPKGLCDWAQDYPAPDPADYRPWGDEEAVWLQLWETVSEGTPVSPAFESAEGLIKYLAVNGDFWDQKRCHEPSWPTLYGGTPGVSGWGRERAERFVLREGYAPSMVIVGGQTMSGVEFVTRDDSENGTEQECME